MKKNLWQRIIRRSTELWRSKKARVIFVCGFLTVASVFFFFNFNTQNIYGATYTFTQTSWSGGADTTATSTHASDQNDWNKYYSASTVTATTSVALTQTAGGSVVGPTTFFSTPSSSVLNYRTKGIAVGSNGVIHVVYASYEFNISTPNIAYRSSADNFASRTDITTSTSATCGNPAIAVDSNNVVHIVYRSTEFNSSHNNIAYRKSSDSFLGRTDITTSTARDSTVPDITVGPDSVIHIVYYSNEYNSTYNNIAYRKSSDSFAGRTDVSANASGYAYNPVIAVGSNNVAHIAYYSKEFNGTYENVAYRSSADNFAARTDVTASTTRHSNYPSIAVNSSNVAYVAYQSREASAGSTNIAMRNSSDNFTTRTDVTSGTRDPAFPVIAIDAANVAHVAYYSQEYTLNDYNIAYRKSTDNFATRTDVTTNGASRSSNQYPAIAVGSDGSAHIINTFQYDYDPEFSTDYYNVLYNKITGSYYGYYGSLISSPFDSTNSGNVIGEISWDEDTTSLANTSSTISIRTAGSRASVLTASWSTVASSTSGCSKSSGTVTCGLSAIPSAMKDGSGDRWFQYRVNLGTSDGLLTPYVHAVRVKYVVNNPPEVQNVTAVQNADGTITIGYQVRDSDTDTASQANIGLITPSFKYFDGTTWVTISTMNSTSTDAKTVTTTDWTSYSAVWTATTDFPNQSTTTARVRVTANDGEAANYSASADSANFSLDTLSPSSNSVVVSASTTPATVFLSSSDTSTIYMKVSLDSSLTGAEWQAFSSPTTISLVTPLPDTVYVQFKDAFNNATSILSATAPETPSSFMLQDVTNTNTTPANAGIFSAWKALDSGFYKVYRSTDQSTWTLIHTTPNNTINYYYDTGTTADTLYYYRVITYDSSNNTSDYSTTLSARANGTQDAEEGGGGSAVPTITNVATSTITPTTAVITWDTDVLSDSSVGYGTVVSVYNTTSSVSTMVNTASSVGNHQVALSGLAPGTSYYFQVESASVSYATTTDNHSGAGYNFSTPSGTTISGVSNPEVTNVSARIVWNTADAANSYVVYSSSTGFTSSVTSGSSSEVTDHTVTLTGLTQASRYYYYVKSTVSGGSETSDKNVINGVVNYYSFNTTNDSDYPTITNIQALPSTSSTEISWDTDEGADTQVEYGLTAAYGSTTTLDSTMTMRHAVSLTGLSASTLYHFRVRSTDANGYLTVSADHTVTTVATPTVTTETVYVGRAAEAVDKTPPTILSVKVQNLRQTSATIVWTTDESGSSVARYGLTQTYNKLAGKDTEYVTDHSVPLSDLTPGTQYFFKAVSRDVTGNAGESASLSFTTLKEGEEPPAAEVVPEKKEEEAAPQEDTLISQISTASEKRLLEILEAFRKNPNLSQISEDIFIRAFSEMTDKVVTAPVIVGIKPVVEVQGVNATVKWTTDKKSDSTVFFARDKDYKPNTNDPYTAAATTPEEFSVIHSVALSNLDPATTYHFQVKSKGLVGPEAKSNDFTFTTGSELPRIFDLSISSAKESSVVVLWKTNIPTAATLEYTNLKDGKVLTQGDATLLLLHNFVLKNLEGGSKYTLKVKVRDEFGNESTSPLLRFSTTVDDIAPLVSKVSSNSTLYPGAESRVQSIITWETDEPSTSQVFYQEGTAEGAEVIALPADTSLVTKHIMVITKFKPGAVYRYWVESKDPSGNVGKSSKFSMLTPQEKETIVDIIINNFEQVFGWTKQIGK